MKIRIKFSKDGPVRFVGHLDTMRYFQKAIRRANLPVSFSAGYSPHMIMSFASPLGVGMASRGEYFDLELSQDLPSAEIISRLNREMADGFSVLSAVRIADGKAGNAMSQVAAADYLLTMSEELWNRFGLPGSAAAFLQQQEILITKTGKSGERQVNIRPWIYCLEEASDALLSDVQEASNTLQPDCRSIPDGSAAGPACRGLRVRLASASSNYTRPDQLLDSFSRWAAIELPSCAVKVTRLEIYANTGSDEAPVFIPLEALGD